MDPSVAILGDNRRLTPQRRLVWEALAATDAHPDAEQLLALARRADPGISVATVYNTVRLLVESGHAIELRGLGPRTRYDANLGIHDHFTCRRCGAVQDIPPQTAVPARLHGRGLARHRVEAMSSIVRGVCGDCRAASRRSPTDPAAGTTPAAPTHAAPRRGETPWA